MAGTIALPLQEFIASLDTKSLPKILQVCSGVYFQGSIYEISGSEVCLSTGDLVKVIGVELQSVSCEDISNNEKFELPISHTGRFRVVPEQMPYTSVEEMLSLRPVGLDSCLPFTFTSSSKMSLGSLTVGAGKLLTVISVERRDGEEAQVRCHIRGQEEAVAEVCIPLSTRGEFYERESEECFSLRDIMASPFLRSRRFRILKNTNCDRVLVLSPVYQVQAVMNLRKTVVKFPSSLEVDVVDATEQCQDVHFVMPLSLTEVQSKPDESFPVVVEILEEPEARSLFKCAWLPQLTKNNKLLFHKKGTTAMVLISSLKGRKAQQYFLLTQQYGGRFRRRPREFNSVYELYVALTQSQGLTVSVTKNCEEVEEEGLPGLSTGDKLEILSCTRMELPSVDKKGQKQSVEALLCHRLQEPDDDVDDDDDDDANEDKDQQEKEKEVFLPLYMQGHFMELLSDKKKYKLSDLGKDFSLPLDVKVVSRDTELESDPLVGFPCLRIEGAMLEPTINASFLNRPDRCFELPVQWVSLTVSFTKDPLPWPHGQRPACFTERITETTDNFFYEFRKKGLSGEAPPPRPPKRDLTSKSSSKSSSKTAKKSTKAKKTKDKGPPTEKFSDLTLNNKKRTPAPPPPPESQNDGPPPPPIAPRKHSPTDGTTKALPNTYVKMNQPGSKEFPCEVAADVESDHDYETVDDALVSMVKTAQESVTFF